jgi:hypothetical protein
MLGLSLDRRITGNPVITALANRKSLRRSVPPAGVGARFSVITKSSLLPMKALNDSPGGIHAVLRHLSSSGILLSREAGGPARPSRLQRFLRTLPRQIRMVVSDHQGTGYAPTLEQSSENGRRRSRWLRRFGLRRRRSTRRWRGWEFPPDGATPRSLRKGGPSRRRRRGFPRPDG